AFLTEIPAEVTEEVKLARRATYGGSWRERPLRGGQAPRLSSSTSPAIKDISSFFQNSPVQFDPSSIRAARSEPARAELKRGARVRHDQFGDGTILTMEGNGPEAKLTVYFDRAGSKKFIAKYAKLTRSEGRNARAVRGTIFPTGGKCHATFRYWFSVVSHRCICVCPGQSHDSSKGRQVLARGERGQSARSAAAGLAPAADKGRCNSRDETRY